MYNEDKIRTSKKVLKNQIELIKKAGSESKIYGANQHLFDLDSNDFGSGGGELSCAGLIAYVLNCDLLSIGDFACLVTFNAAGISWDAGAFTAQVVGPWLVNPRDVAGKCYYTCQVVDVGEGMVHFSLFSKKHGSLYGTFIGDTEGAELADMHGHGNLSVILK